MPVCIFYKLGHICDGLVESSFICIVQSENKIYLRYADSNSLKLCFSMWEYASAQGAQQARGQMNYFKVCSSVSFKLFPAANHEFQDDKVTTDWFSLLDLTVVTPEWTVITSNQGHFFHYSEPFRRAVIHHSLDMWCIRSRSISMIYFSLKTSSLVPLFFRTQTRQGNLVFLFLFCLFKKMFLRYCAGNTS